MKAVKNWTEEQVKAVTERYATTDTRTLAAEIGKTYSAVKAFAKNRKIKKAGRGVKKPWTDAEDDYLRKHYPDGSIDMICDALGRSKYSVAKRVDIIGVRRSAAYMAALHAKNGRFLTKAGVKNRFKKGGVSALKGKRLEDIMSPEALENSKKTRFKKGQTPHNYKPIGYERVTVDGYVEVKVRDDAHDSKNNFELKQRIIWAEHNGPVPPGHVVEFIDGNRYNFSVQNLRLITREQNLLANTVSDTSILKRFLKIRDPDAIAEYMEKHPELIELKRQQVKINGKLKKLKKGARKA